MFNRCGILLSFFAVFLQIAVFLQPLLPEQYQVAPICETISIALLSNLAQKNTQSAHSHHVVQSEYSAVSSAKSISLFDTHHHDIDSLAHTHSHDAGHQCQYCTVYANLILPPELGVKEVLVSIQVRLLFFKRQFAYVYFVLQRLFLVPQGRAPPTLISI